MTSVVVWKNQNTKQVLAASDSLFTSERPLTEQASKLLPLRVSAHRPIQHSGTIHWQGVLELRLGFAYAGAIVPALVTYTMLARLLSAAGATPVRLPPLQKVADLAADIAATVIYDTAQGYGCRYERAVFECAIFGNDIGDAVNFDEYGSDVGAFHCHPEKRTDTLPLVNVKRVDLDAGEFLVMGRDTNNVANDVLKRDPSRRFVNEEPADALAEIIDTSRYNDVGGFVQIFSPLDGIKMRNGAIKAPNVFGYSVQRAENLLGLELPLLRQADAILGEP